MAFPLALAGQLAALFAPTLLDKIGLSKRGQRVANDLVSIAAAATKSGETDPAKIIEALREDSAARAEFEARARELELEEHRADLEEMANARAYRAQTGDTGGTVLLWGVVAGFVVCVAFLYLGRPEDALSGFLIGIAGACFKMIQEAFSFYWGSSRGSKQKDIVLERVTEGMEKMAAERRDSPPSPAQEAPSLPPVASPPPEPSPPPSEPLVDRLRNGNLT